MSRQTSKSFSRKRKGDSDGDGKNTNKRSGGRNTRTPIDLNKPVTRRPWRPRNGSRYPDRDLTCEELIKNIADLTLGSNVVLSAGQKPRHRVYAALNDGVEANRELSFEETLFSKSGLRMSENDDEKKNSDEEGFYISFNASENKVVEELYAAIKEQVEKQVTITSPLGKSLIDKVAGDVAITKITVKDFVKVPRSQRSAFKTKGFSMSISPEYTSVGLFKEEKKDAQGKPIGKVYQCSWNDFTGLQRDPEQHTNYFNLPGDYMLTWKLSHFDVTCADTSIILSPISRSISLYYILTEMDTEIPQSRHATTTSVKVDTENPLFKRKPVVSSVTNVTNVTGTTSAPPKEVQEVEKPKLEPSSIPNGTSDPVGGTSSNSSNPPSEDEQPEGEREEDEQEDGYQVNQERVKRDFRARLQK
jgi:hypothetical protein